MVIQSVAVGKTPNLQIERWTLDALSLSQWNEVKEWNVCFAIL